MTAPISRVTSAMPRSGAAKRTMMASVAAIDVHSHRTGGLVSDLPHGADGAAGRAAGGAAIDVHGPGTGGLCSSIPKARIAPQASPTSVPHVIDAVKPSAAR